MIIGHLDFSRGSPRRWVHRQISELSEGGGGNTTKILFVCQLHVKCTSAQPKKNRPWPVRPGSQPRSPWNLRPYRQTLLPSREPWDTSTESLDTALVQLRHHKKSIWDFVCKLTQLIFSFLFGVWVLWWVTKKKSSDCQPAEKKCA